MALVDQELSEPYSIFTYRYFAFHQGRCVGTVVCKMSEHRNSFRGYIAMLVVIKPYRGKGIATELVTRAIQLMMEEYHLIILYIYTLFGNNLFIFTLLFIFINFIRLTTFIIYTHFYLCN
ncbi:hypothetical protein UlMin_014949 [Ulmus minor]